MLAKDMASIEVKESRLRNGALKVSTQAPAGVDHPSLTKEENGKEVAESGEVTELALGLRTAVLGSAIHWLLRHCTARPEAAVAGEAGFPSKMRQQLASTCGKHLQQSHSRNADWVRES